MANKEALERYLKTNEIKVTKKEKKILLDALDFCGDGINDDFWAEEVENKLIYLTNINI